MKNVLLFWCLHNLFHFSIQIPERNLGGICKFSDLQTSSNSSSSLCENMAPRKGLWPAETTPCPWRIFIFDKYIRPHHIQPVTFGSISGKETFTGYMIKARPLSTTYRTPLFLGHFEPQWDASFLCCGGENSPNMLVSTQARVLKPNETVYWASPNDYLGKFVFEMTFITSSKKYWRNVVSEPMKVVPHCYDQYHPHIPGMSFRLFKSSMQNPRIP